MNTETTHITQPHENTVMLCAGGTGGHMFPALALADDLSSRGVHPVIVTDKRGKRFINDHYGWTVHVIESATLPRGIMGKIKGIVALAKGWAQSCKLIRTYRPVAVVGFGGYPSMPPLVAAQQKKIPTIIHEQNAVLGRANKFLAKKATRIALSLDMNGEKSDRIVVTGNPVRADIATLSYYEYTLPAENEPFNILVLGGSQGAKIMRAVVPDALVALPLAMRKKFFVMQQCHVNDIPDLTRQYDEAGIKADIRPFFDNVHDALGQTHLLISRSGASTVAEVCIAGCPAIYVPFAHHADQQQKVNAETVSERGGAWVIEEKDFTPETLTERIMSFMESPEQLLAASLAARECARPEAAQNLGNVVMAVAAQNKGKK